MTAPGALLHHRNFTLDRRAPSRHDSLLNPLNRYARVNGSPARLVLPGHSYHMTQYGNRRQQAFFCDDDYAAYRELLASQCAAHGETIWSCMLMPNQVHLILVPEHLDALRAALSKVHRAYAGRIHAREKRTGHFWQGRICCTSTGSR